MMIVSRVLSVEKYLKVNKSNLIQPFDKVKGRLFLLIYQNFNKWITRTSSLLWCFVAREIFILKRIDHITFLLFWLKYTSSQYVSIMAKQTPRSFFHSAKKQEMKTFSNLIEKSNIGKWCSVVRSCVQPYLAHYKSLWNVLIILNVQTNLIVLLLTMKFIKQSLYNIDK